MFDELVLSELAELLDHHGGAGNFCCETQLIERQTLRRLPALPLGTSGEGLRRRSTLAVGTNGSGEEGGQVDRSAVAP
jgi:hypothetical protein